jgi:hypothetical protein
MDKTQNLDSKIEEYRAAVKLDPNDEFKRGLLTIGLLRKGLMEESIEVERTGAATDRRISIPHSC